MNRRSFLKIAAALPACIAVPALAKQQAIQWGSNPIIHWDNGVILPTRLRGWEGGDVTWVVAFIGQSWSNQYGHHTQYTYYPSVDKDEWRARLDKLRKALND